MSPLRGRALAVYVFCCAVWGSTWLVIKVGLRDLPPFTFAGMRMGLACLLMAPAAFAAGRGRVKVPRRSLGWIAFCGFLQIGVSYAFTFQAGMLIPSALSAILFASFPIFVGLFGHWLLPDEPLTPRAVAAALTGLAGVAVIQGPEVVRALAAKPGPLFVGGLLIIGSAISAALANVLNKKHFAEVSPAQNVWGQTLVGAAFLLLLAASTERGAQLRWTTTSVFSLGYLAVFGTALTFAGLFWLIPRVPVAVIGTIPLVDMVVATLLGAAILGETLSARVFAGAALILVGVTLAARPARGTGSIAPGGR
jgi:drug/metabolite transporter (DMT)-like permease